MTFIANILLVLIKIYQKAISPLIPARCRYYPTCSEYALTAIKWHGAVKGGSLLAARLSRCHPLGGSGIDFVPIPLYKYQFYYSPLLKHSFNNESALIVNVPHETHIYSTSYYSRNIAASKGYKIPCVDKFSYRARLNYLLNQTYS